MILFPNPLFKREKEKYKILKHRDYPGYHF